MAIAVTVATQPNIFKNFLFSIPDIIMQGIETSYQSYVKDNMELLSANVRGINLHGFSSLEILIVIVRRDIKVIEIDILGRIFINCF